MRVIAAPGLRVPDEILGRPPVTDAVAVDVPDSPYWRRRIADGDLVEVVTATATAIAVTAPAVDASPAEAPAPAVDASPVDEPAPVAADTAPGEEH